MHSSQRPAHLRPSRSKGLPGSAAQRRSRPSRPSRHIHTHISPAVSAKPAQTAPFRPARQFASTLSSPNELDSADEEEEYVVDDSLQGFKPVGLSSSQKNNTSTYGYLFGEIFRHLPMKSMIKQNPDLLSMKPTKIQHRLRELSQIVLHPAFYDNYFERFIRPDAVARKLIPATAPQYGTLPRPVQQYWDAKRANDTPRAFAVVDAELEQERAAAAAAAAVGSASTSATTTTTTTTSKAKSSKKQKAAAAAAVQPTREERIVEYKAAIQQYQTLHAAPYHPLVLHVFQHYPLVVRRRELDTVLPTIVQLFQQFEDQPVVDDGDDVDQEHKQGDELAAADADAAATASAAARTGFKNHLPHLASLREFADTRGVLDPYAILGRNPTLFSLDLTNRVQEKLTSMTSTMCQFLNSFDPHDISVSKRASSSSSIYSQQDIAFARDLVLRLVLEQPEILRANVNVLFPKRLRFLQLTCLFQSRDEFVSMLMAFPRVLSPKLLPGKLQRLALLRMKPPHFQHIQPADVRQLGYEAQFAAQMVQKLSELTPFESISAQQLLHPDAASLTVSPQMLEAQDEAYAQYNKAWSDVLTLEQKCQAVKLLSLMHNKSFGLLFPAYTNARRAQTATTPRHRRSGLSHPDKIISHLTHEYDKTPDQRADLENKQLEQEMLLLQYQEKQLETVIHAYNTAQLRAATRDDDAAVAAPTKQKQSLALDAPDDIPQQDSPSLDDDNNHRVVRADDIRAITSRQEYDEAVERLSTVRSQLRVVGNLPAFSPEDELDAYDEEEYSSQLQEQGLLDGEPVGPLDSDHDDHPSYVFRNGALHYDSDLPPVLSGRRKELDTGVPDAFEREMFDQSIRGTDSSTLEQAQVPHQRDFADSMLTARTKQHPTREMTPLTRKNTPGINAEDELFDRSEKKILQRDGSRLREKRYEQVGKMQHGHGLASALAYAEKHPHAITKALLDEVSATAHEDVLTRDEYPHILQALAKHRHEKAAAGDDKSATGAVRSIVETMGGGSGEHSDLTNAQVQKYIHKNKLQKTHKQRAQHDALQYEEHLHDEMEFYSNRNDDDEAQQDVIESSQRLAQLTPEQREALELHQHPEEVIFYDDIDNILDETMNDAKHQVAEQLEQRRGDAHQVDGAQTAQHKQSGGKQRKQRLTDFQKQWLGSTHPNDRPFM